MPKAAHLGTLLAFGLKWVDGSSRQRFAAAEQG